MSGGSLGHLKVSMSLQEQYTYFQWIMWCNYKDIHDYSIEQPMFARKIFLSLQLIVLASSGLYIYNMANYILYAGSIQNLITMPTAEPAYTCSSIPDKLPQSTSCVL